MSQFEYVSVLVSIVLGLGIAEIIISWARLLQNRENVQFYWLHGFWSAFTLFLIVQFWWGFWNYRTLEKWSLTSLAFLVLETITLVLCVIVISPTRIFAGELNLERFYFENAKPFFLIAVLAIAQFGFIDIFLQETPIFHERSLVRAAAVSVSVAVAFTQNRTIHRAFPFAGLSLLAAFLFNTIRV